VVGGRELKMANLIEKIIDWFDSHFGYEDSELCLFCQWGDWKWCSWFLPFTIFWWFLTMKLRYGRPRHG